MLQASQNNPIVNLTVAKRTRANRPFFATRTRFLRDQVIKEELRETSNAGTKKILGFYEAFQKHLIFNLKPDEFADLYAQTITSCSVSVTITW